MNREDVIRMAREAGFPMAWISDSGVLTWTDMEKFAALVAAAEREACAKEAELMAPKAASRRRNSFLESGHLSPLQIENEATGAALVALRCAAAIRARGQA